MDANTAKRRAIRASFYVGIFSILAIIVTGWWLGSGASLTVPGGRLIAIGRLFGLLCAFTILLQVFLMSRLPFLEENFDLHEMIDLHRLNGYAILLAICTHVICITIGYATPTHHALISQFLTFNTSYDDILWATIGTLVFFTATALSIYAVRKHLRYELWYFIHLTIYGAILLTFLHQLKNGGDFMQQQWFVAFWYMLYFGVAAFLAYYRFLTPALNLWKHQFSVGQITQEADGIVSVYIYGRNIERFRFKPGQYATWRFLDKNLWLEGHPFSFSDAPGKQWIRFTAKASGDFSSKLQNLPIGTKVLIDGPRGAFTAKRAQTPDVLLIAGGIGLAPYLSTIPQLLSEGKHIQLLYAIRDRGQLAFRNELVELNRRGVSIKLFDSSTGSRIDQSTLQTFNPETTTVYVCGPDAMAQSILDQLASLGFYKDRVITERFAF